MRPGAAMSRRLRLMRRAALAFAAMSWGACRSASPPAGDAPSTAIAHAPAYAPESFRVMTFNIAAGNGDLARIAATIRDAAPDLVALQEVDVHWASRSGFADQAMELAVALGMEARFAPIYDLPPASAGEPRRQYGVALLSRFPIVSFANRQLTRLSTQTASPTPLPAPGLLDATIDVHGLRVRVFDTHLDYRADPAVRATQVRETLALIEGAREPLLLFGDLNATPDATELTPLLARLHDLWPGVGAGAGTSYPAKAPVKRIDYVLGSAHFHATSARVIETLASDHRPVVMDLVSGGRRGSSGGRRRR